MPRYRRTARGFPRWTTSASNMSASSSRSCTKRPSTDASSPSSTSSEVARVAVLGEERGRVLAAEDRDDRHAAVLRARRPTSSRFGRRSRPSSVGTRDRMGPAEVECAWPTSSTDSTTPSSSTSLPRNWPREDVDEHDRTELVLVASCPVSTMWIDLPASMSSCTCEQAAASSLESSRAGSGRSSGGSLFGDCERKICSPVSCIGTSSISVDQEADLLIDTRRTPGARARRTSRRPPRSRRSTRRRPLEDRHLPGLANQDDLGDR